MQTLKNQKFYKRLITTFIIVSVLPCSLIGLFSSILVDRVIQDRLIREASLTTENAISSISDLIAKYTDALENFSMNDSVLSLLCSSNKDELQIKTIYSEMYNIQTSLHPSGDVHIIRSSDDFTISLHGTPKLYDYPKNQNWGNIALVISLVNIPPPSPYSESFAILITSSASLNLIITATGSNISSLAPSYKMHFCNFAPAWCKINSNAFLYLQSKESYPAIPLQSDLIIYIH